MGSTTDTNSKRKRITRPVSPNAGTIPARFTPRFWADTDRRVSVVREIELRITRLKADSNANSYQKEILCERAVFIIAQLETMERDACEGVKALPTGKYVQAVNGLLGLLKSLGLERAVKPVALAQYVADVAGEDAA
jgi:hypothetical protein